jgi:hypothetical protein
MVKILMEFERGGKITATLFEDRVPMTCQSFLEVLPYESKVIHAMWAGEEIFFHDFPAKFVYEHPTQDVHPGTLAMVPSGSAFCIFYGRAIPRRSVDENIDVTVFGQVDDVDAMVEIGKRVRMKGTEKIRLLRT